MGRHDSSGLLLLLLLLPITGTLTFLNSLQYQTRSFECFENLHQLMWASPFIQTMNTLLFASDQIFIAHINRHTSTITHQPIQRQQHHELYQTH